jgi:hypothetical protein
MRRTLIFVPLLAAALLQGCSDKDAGTPAAEATKVTQTRMNDIDSLEGTISDEMIITDDANDQPALEPEKETKTLPGKTEAEPDPKPEASKPEAPKPEAKDQASSSSAE